MLKLAGVIYGFIAYAVSLAAFLYAVGFLGSWVVPKSIALATTSYILIALQWEERDLIASLGHAHGNYRK
jgi:protein-S-isoprenylcysteine O-methyltransferase Ste14